MTERDYATLAQQVIQQFADKGQLVESGFLAFCLTMFEGATSDPIVLARDRGLSRIAFFAGAKFVFDTLAMMMEGGDDMTDNDLQRMRMIDGELQKFEVRFREFIAQRGQRQADRSGGRQ